MISPLRTATALGLVLGLSACGGGGGVSSPGSTAPVTTSAPTPAAPAPNPTPTPVASTPTPAPTNTPAQTEYALSEAAVGMKANAAYALGLSGKGVEIAVIDTGIDTGGSEFAGRISPDSTAFDQKVARCATCDVETVHFDLKDQDGHGTETAAIAAAAADGKGIQGVAPGATILALKVSGADLSNATATSGPIPESSSPNPALIAPAIKYAVDKGAFVISMSLNGFASGQMAQDQHDAMSAVAAGNRLLVESVSNDAGQDSFAGQIAQNLVGTDFANKSWFLFGIRVDANLKAPVANGIPGALADRTLAVVAENVTSIGPDGKTVTVDGNSFAAPAIAGAAALLKEYWPQLGGKEIAQILLDSADDLGAPGVDQTYGVGLLDVAAALKSNGAVVVKSSVAVAQTAVQSVTFSGAFGSGQGAAKWGSFAGRAVAIDRYGRDYAVSLNEAAPSRAAQGLSIWGRVTATPVAPAPAATRLAESLTDDSSLVSAHPVQTQAPASFSFRTSPDTVVSGTLNGSVEDDGLASGSMYRVLGLATAGASTRVDMKGWTVGLSSAVENDRRSVSDVQTVRVREPHGFTVAFADGRETGSALGLRGTGDYLIAGAHSRFASVGWQGGLRGFALTAEATIGTTSVDAHSARLSFDSIRTTGFRAQADHAAFGGVATLGVTSPLHVDSARVRYVGHDAFDVATLSVADLARTTDLAPGAREVDLELGWARAFGRSSLSLGGVWGFDSGNQAGVGSAGGWVRFARGF